MRINRRNIRILTLGELIKPVQDAIQDLNSLNLDEGVFSYEKEFVTEEISAIAFEVNKVIEASALSETNISDENLKIIEDLRLRIQYVNASKLVEAKRLSLKRNEVISAFDGLVIRISNLVDSIQKEVSVNSGDANFLINAILDLEQDLKKRVAELKKEFGDFSDIQSPSNITSLTQILDNISPFEIKLGELEEETKSLLEDLQKRNNHGFRAKKLGNFIPSPPNTKILFPLIPSPPAAAHNKNNPRQNKLPTTVVKPNENLRLINQNQNFIALKNLITEFGFTDLFAEETKSGINIEKIESIIQRIKDYPSRNISHNPKNSNSEQDKLDRLSRLIKAADLQGRVYVPYNDEDIESQTKRVLGVLKSSIIGALMETPEQRRSALALNLPREHLGNNRYGIRCNNSLSYISSMIGVDGNESCKYIINPTISQFLTFVDRVLEDNGYQQDLGYPIPKNLLRFQDLELKRGNRDPKLHPTLIKKKEAGKTIETIDTLDIFEIFNQIASELRYPCNILHFMARSGTYHKELINHVPKINKLCEEIDSEGNTPILWAIANGHFEFALQLAKIAPKALGISDYFFDSKLSSPSIDITKNDAGDIYGNYPLHLAIIKNRPRNFTNDRITFSFHPAIVKSLTSDLSSVDLVKEFLALGADANKKNTHGLTALDAAILTGNKDMVSTVLNSDKILPSTLLGAIHFMSSENLVDEKRHKIINTKVLPQVNPENVRGKVCYNDIYSLTEIRNGDINEIEQMIKDKLDIKMKALREKFDSLRENFENKGNAHSH